MWYAVCSIITEGRIALYSMQKNKASHLWDGTAVRHMLQNPTYLGDLVQLKTTTVSYKNHKNVKRDKEDWIVVPNTHEAIISRELWDKVREVEASVSQGKKTKRGRVDPLSGFMFCPDCGEKMRLMYNNTTNGSKKKPRIYVRQNYNCGTYNRFGKRACKSHYIKMKDMQQIIITDIRARAELAVTDEEAARAYFMLQKEQYNSEQNEADIKRLNLANKRLAELKTLIPSIYEDKVIGKIPEDVCVSLLEKYQAE